ncbi:MAG TPA: ATP-binding SpoIIE family protein phosphatase [Terriglobales bacterium]|nr:ATP-binding SpoIIE family protein phosphatase [Terriglobales bacterium]
MPINHQISISVREEAEVSHARRRALQLASNAGLNDTEAGRAALIASEAATNLIKHGKGGELLLRELENGIEVIGIDKGPGMQDVSTCLSDGFSTSGTSGTGLGAIRRMSSLFDIYSRPHKGTAIVSRLSTTKNEGEFECGVISRPKHGEIVNGDGWAQLSSGSRQWILLVDGLGHGPSAHEAAVEATGWFRKNRAETVADCIEGLHGTLRKTRGAAVAVAQIDREAQQIRFSGVGNIAAALIEGTTIRSMVSHNGILGHEVRRIQEFSYPWNSRTKLVMNSDGLATWHIEKYPGLMQRHPAIVAGVLYRDYWRERDDVTVFVGQEAA